jgi:hypothetical protein
MSRQVAWKMLDSGDPDIQRWAMRTLGVITEGELPAAPATPIVVTPPPAAPAEPEPEAAPGQGPPDTLGDPAPRRINPPTRGTPVAPAAALMAAADGLVFRALERAGNRLRSATARQRQADASADCVAALMHTCCNAARVKPLDQLLEGAWDRLPEVATRLGEPADAFQAALDGYVRVLIRTRTPHSWDTLAVALGVDGELAAA